MAPDWRRAQRRLGVAVDGDPGPLTWAALMARAAGAGDASRGTIVLRARALARRPEWASPERVCHFLAETSHETAGYVRLREGMSYSSAARIRATWPTRFRTDAAAAPYVRQPVALANLVYARPREGNTQPGDGWRFRGGGDIQTTFRNGFARASLDVGVDLVADPDRIAEPGLSILTALGYYRRSGIWALIDAGRTQAARAVVNTGSPDTPRGRIIGLSHVDAGRESLLTLFK